jgi:hypothetical protein
MINLCGEVMYGVEACPPWHGRAKAWCERKRRRWRPPRPETMARNDLGLGKKARRNDSSGRLHEVGPVPSLAGPSRPITYNRTIVIGNGF